MARTVEVSKVSVIEVMSKMFNITCKLKYLDDMNELLNKDFTLDKKDEITIGAWTTEMGKLMQEAIDKYKREETIFKNSALDNAIINIQNALLV